MARKPTIDSRAKGARVEREVVQAFRSREIDAERTAPLQAARIAGAADVRADLVIPSHIEVKGDERMSTDAMWRQACRDAPEGVNPLVVFKRSRQPFRVMCSLDHYLELQLLALGVKNDPPSEPALRPANSNQEAEFGVLHPGVQEPAHV